MSHMAREAAEAPEAVARFLQHNSSVLREIGAQLRRQPPPVIITSARGSSDNAAGYFQIPDGNSDGSSMLVNGSVGCICLRR